MKIGKALYKTMRSLLLGAVVTVASIFILVYVAISIPAVQNRIKGFAEEAASTFLGSEVRIGKLNVMPFNEVVLDDVSVFSPDGKPCIDIERVGAGVRLGKLIFEGRVELSYAEVMGLNARITKASPDSPLNINFIIEAFKPKEENKEKPKIDLKMRSIVLRRSTLSYDNLWMPVSADDNKFDANHIRLENLRADLTIPELRDGNVKIDLRRLSFRERGGLTVDKISGIATIAPSLIQVEDLVINLPSTHLQFSDLSLPLDGSVKESLSRGIHEVHLIDSRINPYDLRCFLPLLSGVNESYDIALSASGNLQSAAISNISVEGQDLSLSLAGEASSFMDLESLDCRLEDFQLRVDNRLLNKVVQTFNLPAGIAEKVAAIGSLELHVGGEYVDKKASVDAAILCGLGSLQMDGSAVFPRKGKLDLRANLSSEGIDLGQLLGQPEIGMVAFTAEGVAAMEGKEINGNLDLMMPYMEYGDKHITDLNLQAWKEDSNLRACLSVDDDDLSLDFDGAAVIEKEHKSLIATARLNRFQPAMFGLMKQNPNMVLSGDVDVDVSGSNLDDVVGAVTFANLKMLGSKKGNLSLEHLEVTAENDPEGERQIHLRSDWMDADVQGRFQFARLPQAARSILTQTMPGWLEMPEISHPIPQDLNFAVTIKKERELTEFFRLPFTLLVDIPITGGLSQSEGRAWLNMDIPYLQQGRDKLIRATSLNAELNANSATSQLLFKTILPGKDNTEVNLDLDINGLGSKITTLIGWDFNRKAAYKGRLSFEADMTRGLNQTSPTFTLQVNPSEFQVNDTTWHISKGLIGYSNKRLAVTGVSARHGDQFIAMSGLASANREDTLRLNLRDVNLDYVFESLNINYVNFGGNATGDFKIVAPFSKEPVAYTDNLFVRGLKYNGAVLGDGDLKAHWDNVEQEAAIYADIKEHGKRVAIVDGGIWATRDSLSFDFTADNVNARFVGPFMAAFSSDVRGRASGHAKLYGTFADVNLIGRLYANEIDLLLDYTNVRYSGSDSIIMTPGLIKIPSFKIHDRDGNTAVLTGQVTHNYFHEPSFDFKVTDAKRILAYDTNPSINPDWYGTIYASGGGTIHGYPGYVGIMLDMTTDRNSDFTFVLNDTKAAEDYQFLTFTDRKKDLIIAEQRDTIVDFVEMFRKKVVQQAQRESLFELDLRATVRPSTTLNLIMDPVGGDKITAKGNGYVQMTYDSDSDDLAMYGKYTVEEGSYNFTLQDIIVRDFTIRQGSSISFNGDPYNATLNIDGLYRVNTNLTDLDKSFSTDRDLNRTNVPVDAVLRVTGSMLAPDISFDVELPTLTQDVERKVKAIISTDDMMSRQIIYLLALGRFYTPEYMSTTNRGNELAAVASTTISSQLTNILGQISDNWTIAPSFRSDKGDFSDIEADLTLSSRLLNNRLLINGNFGYRDRATSSTTFVGDFDIEYLLNRSGNLRLKAYNHYNDQNYYLRSALTTQGIGVLYRHDFNSLFNKRKKKKEKEEATDSVAP